MSFESTWWGNCVNTLGEELKQTTYASYMGLQLVNYGGPGPLIELDGHSVLDIGGGPCSLLLKATQGAHRVLDPLPVPQWVIARYAAHGIAYDRREAESALPALDYGVYDEAWLYNVLQHTNDPELIVREASRIAPLVRLFEWVDIPAHDGHPQELHAADLDRWLGGQGLTVELDDATGCRGRAYVFVSPF